MEPPHSQKNLSSYILEIVSASLRATVGMETSVQSTHYTVFLERGWRWDQERGLGCSLRPRTALWMLLKLDWQEGWVLGGGAYDTASAIRKGMWASPEELFL